MPATRLYFLGSPRFLGKDTPVALTSAKAIALLAYLATAKTPQPRERVMALLWPDSLEDAARKNLRNTLWTIRRDLGEDTLRTESAQLALSENVWVDTREFETLLDHNPLFTEADQQAILDLYQGPFLDGFNLNDAPDFELWSTAERERLGQLYLRTLAAFVETHRSEGNWQAVIAVAQRALAYDPLQEPMHRLLIEAYARLGQRSEAVHQYESLRTVLNRELGVEPLAETQRLYEAVHSGELQPVNGGSSPYTRPTLVEPSRSAASGSPFIGRQAERGILDSEFQMALSGQARVVLITGEAGIGKSRLWREWAATLPPTVVIMEARCLDATQTLPFAPLTDLFSRPVCMQQISNAAVSPIWLAEVARLLPDIRALVPNLPAPAVLPAEEERRRVFEAFTQFLSPPDARPLILFMDDLHWADQTTLDWLAYMINRLRDHKVMLVGTYRLEDAPAALIRHAAHWSRQGLMQRMALARLTNEESASLISAMGGNPMLTTRVQAQSAGNPYFLIELVRTGADDIPPALTELIRTRLDRLPDTAQQILQAAAVLDSDFTYAMLRSTSGRGEEETLDALDVLLNSAVLVERGSQYAFAHPLVAAVVQDSLSGARRAFLHRRAALALESAFGNRLAPVAGQLITHFAQAGDPVQAARYAEMAADYALTLAATTEAMDFYKQALELDPTPARYMGVGNVLYRQANVNSAREAFQQAFDGFAKQHDKHGQTQVALSMAETYIPSGEMVGITYWVERAAATMNSKTDPESHARAHFLRGAGLLVTEQPLEEAEKHLNEAITLSIENSLNNMAARSRFELGNLFAQRGDLASALDAYRESMMFAQSDGDQFQEVLARNNLAYHAILSGDLATAREQVEIGLSIAETAGFRVPLQYLYSTRGELALAESQWEEAERWFYKGLAEAERYGNIKQAANYQANLGLALRGRGDLDGALMMLEAAHEASETFTWPHLQIQVDLWLTELYLDRGERTAATEALSRAETRLHGTKRERLQAWARHLRQMQSAPTQYAEP
jgi:DNA-binding SARP family transcriptional activator